MISRRLLRIKALLIFYAFNRKKGDDLETAEKELMKSINSTFDLYHLILQLILDVVRLAEEKVEIARNKKVPTYEDLNPNTRFIDNRFIKQLESNRELKSYISKKHLHWGDFSDIPRMLYNRLLEWPAYKDYMTSKTRSYKADRKFIASYLANIIASSEDVESALEEMSIYWNDDLEFVIAMLEKTIRQFKEDSDENFKLMPLFRNEDDSLFVKTLLRKAILKSEENSKLIDSNTTNWEIERVALMDKLVMQLAITEILEFSEIPVKVTLNEYIEIAKYYCTAKSGTFVNGILDKIVREMREKELIKKMGRGLIGEPGFEQE